MARRQTSPLFVPEGPLDQANEEHVSIKQEERGDKATDSPDVIVIDEDEGIATPTPSAPGPYRIEKRKATPRRRVGSGIPSPEPSNVIDLDEDEDDDPNLIPIRIPGEPLVRLQKDQLLPFIKGKGTRIFRNASKRCLLDKLERTLTYHTDTLARGTPSWIVQCYEKDWKVDLKRARRILEKELALSEKIREMHKWEEESNKYDRTFVKEKKDRLAEAKAGEAVFQYLVNVLKEQMNTRVG